MNDFFAALPMYDWPENRAEVDADWMALRARLAKAGIDAPKCLVRRNADMPPVSGGIRDARGVVIAPDPATLPPDELDFFALWTHPSMLFAQTCWGPLELGLARHVRVIGQPDYSSFEGGDGVLYSSAIVMRRDGLGENRMASQSGGAEGGAKQHALPIHLLRNQRLAFNSEDSMSGLIALARDLQAMGESLDIFSERFETGGHRKSIVAVAEGRADVATIDCRSWAMAKRFEPRSRDVAVVGWTAKRKGLPYISGLNSPLTFLPD